MVSYIEGPFFAAENLNKKEKIKDLRDKIYNSMVENSKKNTYEKIRYVKK